MIGPEVHVVHDGSGRILALVDAAELDDGKGGRLGQTPVPGEGQGTVRLRLTSEHLADGPVGLLARFEVDLGGETPSLRRREG
jgi:hypothetical protein